MSTVSCTVSVYPLFIVSLVAAPEMLELPPRAMVVGTPQLGRLLRTGARPHRGSTRRRRRRRGCTARPHRGSTRRLHRCGGCTAAAAGGTAARPAGAAAASRASALAQASAWLWRPGGSRCFHLRRRRGCHLGKEVNRIFYQCARNRKAAGAFVSPAATYEGA